jgi:hypothetical protein
MKTTSMVAVVVAALIGSVCVQPADAAAWKCGKKRCYWLSDYNGPVPEFAANWGAPESPDCYYVNRRATKKWAKVCPLGPWQAR